MPFTPTLNSPRISVLLLTAISTIPASAQINVFLYAGQSNLVGSGVTAEVNASDQHHLITRPDIAFNYFTQNLGTPQASNGWVDLGLGSGEFGEDGFGIELSSAATLADTYGIQNVAAIKYAYGATNLASDWEKGNTSGDRIYDGGGSVEGFINFTNNAIQDLENSTGMTVNIRGLFWLQGESDTGLTYEADFTQFISNVRNDFGVPDLPVVVAPVSSAGNGSRSYANRIAEVNTAFHNVAALDSNVIIGASTDNVQFRDGLHYGGQGLIDIGVDLANNIATLLPNQVPEPSSALLTLLAGSFCLILRNR